MVAAVALQAVGIVRSVVLLQRWRTHPRRRPHGTARIGARIAVPALLNLLWGLTCLVILPAALGQSLWAAVIEQPSDIGLAVAASGVLAVLWGALARPALAVITLRTAVAAASLPATAPADPIRPAAR